MGAFPQITFTVGVLCAQVLAFKELLGTAERWHLVLAGPLIPALVACVCLVFIPESPVELLKTDELKAKRALQLLRNKQDVNDELADLCSMVKSAGHHARPMSTSALLLHSPALRWPLCISLLLILAQQFSGVNAIFFYSAEIFKSARIPDEYLQYAILSTGVVIFFTSVLCV